MAIDITLNDIVSTSDFTKMNENFTNIEQAFQEAISRSGSTPNSMNADFDMNSRTIINAIFPAGALDFGWTGQWLPSTAYLVNQVVFEAGSSYICLVSHTSDVATFTIDLTGGKWELLAQIGNTGATGSTGATGPAGPTGANGINWRDSWTTSTNYLAESTGVSASAVSAPDGAGTSSYICLVSHTSGTFAVDLLAGKWGLIASKGADGAGVGDMIGSNNLSDVVSAATSRANLGISAATSGITTGAGTPTVDTVQEYIDNTGSAGYYTLGSSSISGANITVGPGTGLIRDVVSSTGQLKSFTWAAQTVAIPTDTIRYLFVNNAGNLTAEANEFNEAENKILVGVAINEGGVITDAYTLGVRLDESIGQAGRYIRRTHGVTYDQRQGGLTFTAGAGTRTLNWSTATLWWGRTKYTVTSGSAGVFDVYFDTTKQSTAITSWPNTQYNNAGTLTVMTDTTKWANLYMYVIPSLSGSKIVMVHGTHEFDSELLAMEEAVPTTLPNRITAGSVLAARLTFNKSATTATITSMFDTTIPTVSTSDHAKLANLDFATSGHTGALPVANGGTGLSEDKRVINAQTGTTYTLVLGDAGGVITMNNAAVNTLTIPLNSSVAFPIGTQIEVIMLGAGVTSVAATGVTTLNGLAAGTATLTAQYKAGTILQTATDVWVYVGDGAVA